MVVAVVAVVLVVNRRQGRWAWKVEGRIPPRRCEGEVAAHEKDRTNLYPVVVAVVAVVVVESVERVQERATLQSQCRRNRTGCCLR